MLLGESSGEEAPAERRGFWGSRGGEEAKAALVSRGRSPWLSGGVSSQASRGTLWDTRRRSGVGAGGGEGSEEVGFKPAHFEIFVRHPR